MYRICKTLEIESGHMLSKHPDKCRFPHGHSRKVEVILAANELDEHGMVCDFKIVKQVLGDFIDRFDHALCVNTADPMYETLRQAYGERIIPFEQTEPTTEVLARSFFDHCAKLLADYAGQPTDKYPLRQSVKLERVRIWETSSSWAEYQRHE